MIIGDQNEVTKAVLEAMEKTPDPRLREIVVSMIKHLHGFIREARLSEEEFQQACNFIVRLGQSDASISDRRVDQLAPPGPLIDTAGGGCHRPMHAAPR